MDMDEGDVLPVDWASTWLYEVHPSDPLILASALALVVGVTVIATVIPVGRAARADPSLALRFE
jgi:hypothetical protein